MSEEFEDELSAEERRALGGLSREQTPPPALEERVVAALKRARLLGPTRSVWRRRAPRVGLAVAASLLCFALGALAGVRFSRPRPDAPEFMLLLRSGPDPARPDSADELRRVGEYSEWAGQLRRQGVRVEGEKLKREARVLRGRAAAAENPSDANAEALAGYFLIGARDYEQAVKIAAGCPHLKYGGSVEVRQIDY
ncbi:MAG TPA: YciI family protein [Pyrinomonadaceae bacterium]|jgi:hypothetical protein